MAACCKTYCIPLFILKSESVLMPTRAAISSAVLKPTPSISSAMRYGFSLSILYISPPYLLYIFTARFILMPYCCKKIMASLKSLFALTWSAISIAFLWLMPFTSASLSGSSSMMRKVSFLKRLTIRAASASPIPCMAPEPRYLSIAISSSGSFSSKLTTLNCLP